MDHDWQTYYQQTKGRQTSPLLVEATTLVTKRGPVLDLGAGALIESKFLLSQDFNTVTAVDAEPQFEAIDDSRFTFVQSTFENFNFPQDTFELVSAQFSLPFNKPQTFALVWEKIKKAITSNGVFTGQLFGPRDTWSGEPNMNFHTKEEVESLLADMEVLKLLEVERDGKTAAGKDKHWHVFHIIARKK